ncbi:eukaryotic translation initiation factor 2 alpha kinase Gcn2 isoform X2 [Tachypleus tridentatus]|uniref:eukaryotic translation initiation factor 2 alpha kinase Gcn2 isoform X2 n=1 Tax=Tachypleus tridentatus TaxID=6853 RepID=UPI003FD5F4C5
MEESLQERQENELNVLQAIFFDCIKDLRNQDVWKVWRPPEVQITLHPQQSMTTGKEVHVQLDLIVRCTENYPNEPPHFSLKNPVGLSNHAVEELREQLVEISEKLKGEVMILELAQHVQKYLHLHNTPRYQSFYDEMLSNKKHLEEKQAEALERQKERQKLLEEKQRQAIQEEIQRKKEALKEEARKRREQIHQSSPNRTRSEHEDKEIVEKYKKERSPSTSRSKSNSPTPKLSASSRRKSTSRCEEDCNHGKITVLTFNNKDKRTIQRGHCLGHSPRGSAVFAGMDTNTGELLTITEWVIKWRHLSRKPTSAEMEVFRKESSAYLKQISSIEQEFGSVIRLYHRNLVHYLGLKYMLEKDKIVIHVLQQHVPGSTLSLYLHENIPLESSMLRHYACGILEALNYLHNNSVVHKNLRDTSVFIENTGLVRVADFSVDKRFYDLYCSTKNENEDQDYPPSVGRGGKKADIYRLGILLLSLIKGELVTDMHPVIPQSLHTTLHDFLRKCLQTDERERWSAQQLLDHPFLKPFVSKSLSVKNWKTTEEADYKKEEEEAEILLPPMLTETTGHSRLKDEFVILKWLGSGGFGDVLKVRNKLDGMNYAIKRILLKPSNKQLNRKIMREVKLLSRLNHENVVRYYNSWIEVTTEVPKNQSETTSSTPNTVGTTSQNIPSQSEKVGMGSLEVYDDIEKLAPPAKVDGSIEWSSISYSCHSSKQQIKDDESSDEEEEEDVFGTSFLPRSDSSDCIVFEQNENFTTDEEKSKRTCAVKMDFESKTDEIENNPRSYQFMYIQMEFCEKSTLRTAIDQGLCKEVEKVWRYFREIIEGLVHIHQQGMIHRDLKPVNIFIDSNDHVKIGDFGLATTDIIAKSALTETSLGAVDNKSLEVPDISRSDVLGDGSLTGQVGTALYLAPELASATSSKTLYSQKVDIYSLGIIFFEMSYPPSPTNMERVKFLLNLRNVDIILPTDVEVHLSPQQIYLVKWLLQHEVSTRPSSQELLSSDYLPPPQMEEAELNEILRHTVSNPQSKAFKQMVKSLFLQQIPPVADFTYDIDIQKGFVVRRMADAFRVVSDFLRNLMHKHGAFYLSVPTLMPKSDINEQNDLCVHLMDHAGGIVTLPYDLRVPFARFIARKEIRQLKRYDLGKVFRERKVYGCHPRELYECAFDIVTPSQGSLLPDAEVLFVVSEIIDAYPALQSHSYLRLNHVSLLKAVLLYCGVQDEKHLEVYRILSGRMNANMTKFQIQSQLINLSLSDQTVASLYQFIEIETSLQKLHSVLQPIIKKKGQVAFLAKQALHELEVIVSHLIALGVNSKINIVVAPSLVYKINNFSGVLFQFVCQLKKKNRKSGMEVLAAGGRYDNLVSMFRLPQSNISSKEISQSAVGVSIAVERIVGALIEDEEFQTPSLVDVLICSLGHSPMLKEKCVLLKDLWMAGINAQVMYDQTESLEEASSVCEENGIFYLVILSDSESGTVKIRTIGKERYSEMKCSFAEVGENIVRLIREKVDQVDSSITKGEISRFGTCSTSKGDTCRTVSATEGGGNSSMSIADIDITFLPQEKMLFSTKKRYEGQIQPQLAPLVQCLSSSSRVAVEVLALEVELSVIKTIATYLELDSETAFEASISEVMERHARHRKYLTRVCDHIYELRFDKKKDQNLVIVLYSLKDSTYRVMFS